jgi:rare lipoprotein A
MKSYLFFTLIASLLIGFTSFAQSADVELGPDDSSYEPQPEGSVKPAVLFGTASYYADKFNGRKTATGHIYSHDKMTAACNKLPLGTWIRVTNLKNKKAVVVQINDRLHPKNPRIVDMSRMAAEKLGYISRGLTQVRVEVLGRKKSR